MALIVHKYGGTSMGSTERIKNVAKRVAKWRRAGHDIVVVPSAMSGETNRLLGLAKEISTNADPRELDMIASTGEQVSVGLLAIALHAEGVEAVSYAGWQVPIRTDSAFTKARIQSIDDKRVRADLAAGKVVVITGFQGVDPEGNISTLGRGGSDTSAVAVAAALKRAGYQVTSIDVQRDMGSFLTRLYPKPDAVFSFFAGAGAVKFVNDYAGAGLKKSIPLYAPGFLTDGTLEAQGENAQGLFTTLHYADGLNTPRDNAFRAAYSKAYKIQPDVYAVQGYDAAQLLAMGLKAVNGDISKKDALYAAMRSAKIDSPRGAFTLSKANNPVQDIYLRQVVGKENKVSSIAVKGLADPARGCKI